MSSHLSRDEMETIRRFVIARRRQSPDMSERRLHGEFVQAHPGLAWIGQPRFRYHVRCLIDEAKRRGLELHQLPLPGEAAPAVIPSGWAGPGGAAQLDEELRLLGRLAGYRRELVAALASVDGAMAAQQDRVDRLVRELTALPGPAGEPHDLSPLRSVEDRAAGPSEGSSRPGPSALGLALALGTAVPSL